MDQIVKYQASGQEVVLTEETVKRYLVNGDPNNVTDQELMMFMNLCKYQKLNPFLREAYLVKYGNSPATIVTGKETYTKRATSAPNCDGYKAGIIVGLKTGELVYREGSFVAGNTEKLLGGWAEAYRKDWKVPVRAEVSLEEYIGRKKDGTPTSMWQSKPATMIRKVALVQALREALPEHFNGTYSPEEINTIEEELPDAPVEIQEAEYEVVDEVEYITDKQRQELFAKYTKHLPLVQEAMHLLKLGDDSTKIPKDKLQELTETVDDMIEIQEKESDS